MKILILILITFLAGLGYYFVDSNPNPVISIASEKAIAVVDEEFLSVSIDTAQIVGSFFWDKEGEMKGGRGKNKLPPLDLSRPEIIDAASRLSPAYLRIGGSEADAVYYNIKGGKRPESFDSEFTTETLENLKQFSTNTGLKLFFTLNQGPSTWTNDKWDTTNLESLLKYLSQSENNWKFELGNEVFAYWAIFGREYQQTEDQYAKNFRKAKSLLATYGLNARLAGPASAYWPIIGEPLGFWFGSMENLIPELENELDVITWHYYPTQSFRCPVAVRRTDKGDLINPHKLDEVSKWGAELLALKEKHAPKSKLWLGETGSAQCGGEPGVSDQYINALWWLDQLGQLAKLKHHVVVRQNLIGADYALLNNDGTPRPDYYASLLWKKYMGRNALGVNFDNRGSKQRFYAHCSKFGDGIVLMAINLDEEFAHFDLSGFPGEKEYEVFEPAKGLYQQATLLNGQPLLNPDQIFKPTPNKQTSDEFRLMPWSITFIQLRGRFKGC